MTVLLCTTSPERLERARLSPRSSPKSRAGEEKERKRIEGLPPKRENVCQICKGTKKKRRNRTPEVSLADALPPTKAYL